MQLLARMVVVVGLISSLNAFATPLSMYQQRLHCLVTFTEGGRSRHPLHVLGHHRPPQARTFLPGIERHLYGVPQLEGFHLDAAHPQGLLVDGLRNQLVDFGG